MTSPQLPEVGPKKKEGGGISLALTTSSKAADEESDIIGASRKRARICAIVEAPVGKWNRPTIRPFLEARRCESVRDAFRTLLDPKQVQPILKIHRRFRSVIQHGRNISHNSEERRRILKNRQVPQGLDHFLFLRILLIIS